MFVLAATLLTAFPTACPSRYFFGPTAFAGRWVATYDGRAFAVRDADTGRVAFAAKRAVPGMKAFAVSPDGKRVTWIDGKYVQFAFDLPTGKIVREIPPPEKDVLQLSWVAAAFTPDGTGVIGRHEVHGYLFAQAAICWDIATGERRWQLAGTGNMSFSPDGRTVYLRKNGLTAFDTGSGKEVWRCDEKNDDPKAWIAALVRQEGGKQYVAVRNNAVVVHDADGAFRRLFPVRPPLPAQLFYGLYGYHSTSNLVVSPDGRWCALACFSQGNQAASSCLEIWELATGTRVRSIPLGPNARPSPKLFTSSGRYLWTAARDVFAGDRDGGAVRWDLLPPKSPCFDRARMWRELAHPDAGVADAAVGRALDGTQWKAMAERFPVERAADATAVTPLLAKLSDRDFAAREEASAAVLKLGPPALPALRALLKAPPSEEARRRAEKALRTLEDGTSPDALTRARLASAVAMLADSHPDARKLLETWASGDTGLPLTTAARVALGK